MDRIHDKANKIFNGARKKKIKINNINTFKDHKDREIKDIRNVSDLTDNSCLFCEKVFITSNYMMKHMYRRHTENLVKLHKKCLLMDSNNSSDFKSLFTFLEDEFSVLKNELHTVKQAVGHKIPRNECNEKDESTKQSPQYTRQINKSCVNDDTIVADIDSSEIDLLKGKVNNIESNIQSLHNKFEEFNSVIKTEVSLRQEIIKHREQESHLVEMRQYLLKELKCIVAKELNENNLKWKSTFGELKHDILKLDQIISDLKKQVDSPDYLTLVEKRLERHIVNFLGTPRSSIGKRKNSRSRSRSKLSLSKGPDKIQNSKISETNNYEKPIISPQAESVHHRSNLEFNKPCISPDELSFLIAERLSHFNISDKASKLSNSEYEDKLKLINSVKNNLSKKYHNFSEIYNSINLYADHRVFSKLKSKRPRKLRFSEPLITSRDRTYNLNPNEADNLNKTYPTFEDKNDHPSTTHCKILPCDIQNSTILERQRFVIPRSEGFSFSDIGGGGECCKNFQESYIATEETSIRDCQTSSPISDTYSSDKRNYSSKKQRSFTDLPTSSDAYKNTGSVTDEIENTYHILEGFRKQDVPFFKSLKISDNTELNNIDSDLDNFDKNSLKSLSSWEDEEN